MASAAFVFSGEILRESFAQFARHRADRLSLEIAFGAAGKDFFDVTVTGDEALVDMFEMACSLGPYDCIIHDVTRRDLMPAAGI